MTLEEFLQNRDSLYANQNWGSGFGLSDEKNNRIAGRNAVFLESGIDNVEAARQALLEARELRDDDFDYLEYSDVEEAREAAEQEIINSTFPFLGQRRAPSLRSPDNPKFYDVYEFDTNPYSDTFGQIKYTRDRERSTEGIKGDQIARIGLSVLSATVPAFAPVANFLNTAEQVYNTATGDPLSAVASRVAPVLADQVVGSLADTAFGSYLADNNLTSDFTSAVSRLSQGVLEGEDIEEAARSAVGTYIREGGGIGGDAENAFVDTVTRLGDSIASVAEPLLGAVGDAFGPIEDVVGAVLRGTGDVIQDTVIDPVVAAGDVIQETIVDPLYNDLLVPAGDFIQDIVDPIEDTAQNIIDPVGDVIQDTVVSAGDVIQDTVIDPVVAAGDVIQDTVIDPVVAAGDVIQDTVIDPVVASGDVIQDTVIDPVVAAGSAIDDIVSEAIPSTSVPNFLEGLRDLFSNFSIPAPQRPMPEMKTTRSLFGDDLFKFHTEIEQPTIGRLFRGIV